MFLADRLRRVARGLSRSDPVMRSELVFLAWRRAQRIDRAFEKVAIFTHGAGPASRRIPEDPFREDGVGRAPGVMQRVFIEMDFSFARDILEGEGDGLGHWTGPGADRADRLGLEIDLQPDGRIWIGGMRSLKDRCSISLAEKTMCTASEWGWRELSRLEMLTCRAGCRVDDCSSISVAPVLGSVEAFTKAVGQGRSAEILRRDARYVSRLVPLAVECLSLVPDEEDGMSVKMRQSRAPCRRPGKILAGELGHDRLRVLSLSS